MPSNYIYFTKIKIEWGFCSVIIGPFGACLGNAYFEN